MFCFVLHIYNRFLTQLKDGTNVPDCFLNCLYSRRYNYLKYSFNTHEQTAIKMITVIIIIIRDKQLCDFYFNILSKSYLCQLLKC